MYIYIYIYIYTYLSISIIYIYMYICIYVYILCIILYYIILYYRHCKYFYYFHHVVKLINVHRIFDDLSVVSCLPIDIGFDDLTVLYSPINTRFQRLGFGPQNTQSSLGYANISIFIFIQTIGFLNVFSTVYTHSNCIIYRLFCCQRIF